MIGMMKYFLPIVRIEKIDLCTAGTKGHFYHYFISCIRQKIFQCTKKYFMYGKASYWSSNHIQQKRNNFIKRFSKHYSEFKTKSSYQQNIHY